MYRQRHLIHAVSGAALLLVSLVLLSMRRYGSPVAVNDQRPGEQPEAMLGDVMDRIGRDEKLKVQVQHLTTGKDRVLRELFIAVKTTKKFHQSRMGLLLLTWISRVKEQTYIFTDEEDDELQRKLGDHVVFTNCSSEHSHLALSCKMAAEFDAFLASGLSWFCHLDDDNYLNPQALLKLLSSYSPDQDVYIGKPSLNRPIHASEILPNNQTKSVYFWFATGGAGFCISWKLATKMAPWARDFRHKQPLQVIKDLFSILPPPPDTYALLSSGDPKQLTTSFYPHNNNNPVSGSNFLITSELIRLPDDCTVGYIIECKLGGHLVASNLFHSHLEDLQLIQKDQLAKQVTFSYGIFEKKLNAIKLAGPFSKHVDPSRFRSLHCILYPDTSWCPQPVTQ